MSSDNTPINDEPLELTDALTDAATDMAEDQAEDRSALPSSPQALPDVSELAPRIAVIGVGGAGGNAVNNMISAGLEGVTFMVANTDAQALAASKAPHRIQLGANLTEGLGAGSKPEIGEAAAEEAIEVIRDQISGCHMVFVAAGMGGGTGTGAAGVIARVAHEMNILTVGVVTKPFHFEGNRRMRAAEAGIAELAKHVDTLIAIPNQNLFRIANEKTTFAKAFEMADQVLHAGISCVTDLIVREGLINLDFADVRAIMLDMGAAMMGTGEASGDKRAVEAAEIAIANPLLDDVTLKGARGLLVSISGGDDLTLYEVDEAANRIREEVDPEANIIVGANFDASLKDAIRVSIVASGLRTDPAVPHQLASPDPVQPKPQLRAQPTAQAPQGQTPPNISPKPPENRTQPRANPTIQALSPAPAPAAPQRPAMQPSSTVSGSVQIEVGPPRMLAAGTPMRRGPEPRNSVNSDQSERQFTPAAPESVKRTPPRMPEIEEFPPMAQRALREQQEQRTAPPPPKKRSKLFDRLKEGLVTSSCEESAKPVHDSTDYSPPENELLNSEQRAEIPGFFKREVRG